MDKQVHEPRIFRLKNGEDIISSYTTNEEDDTLTFFSPMVVGKMKIQGSYSYYMVPWLPIDIIKYDIAIVYADDILTIIEPTDEIVVKYNESAFQIMSKMMYPPSDEDLYKEILEKTEIPDTKH